MFETVTLTYPFALCHTINIINDALLEGDEDFIITVTNTTIQNGDPAVVLPQPLTVIIQDNESKQIIILLHNYYRSAISKFITRFSVDATVDVLPISDVAEGFSEPVCVVLSSQTAESIAFDLTVTVTLNALILSGIIHVHLLLNT